MLFVELFDAKVKKILQNYIVDVVKSCFYVMKYVNIVFYDVGKNRIFAIKF